MKIIFLFLTGMLYANSIPHFIHGISGREFHTPFFYRFVRWIPSPLFNVVWGLFSFFLGSTFLYLYWKLNNEKLISIGFNWNTTVVILGFVFASTGLSIFFNKGGWNIK